MSKMIFVNLPVTDLARSIAFYEAVGGAKNPTFSDPTGACMVFSDSIFVMLLTHGKWREFTSKPIIDAHKEAQVMLCLSAESREAVDALVEKARAAGGKPDVTPVDEYDFMYGRSFEDLDGHMWGVNWLDINAFPAKG